MKLPQYLSSSIQNTKCSTFHCNSENSGSLVETRNNTSSLKETTENNIYTQQLSQCVEKLIPSLRGIFSTEQSLQNAKNYIKHFRCSNNSLNYNPIKIHKHVEITKQLSPMNNSRKKTLHNHNRNLHSMCQLEFGNLHNKTYHNEQYKKENDMNQNNKCDEYDNYYSEPLSHRNKKGIVLKKLNLQESKLNSKKVHFVNANNNKHKEKEYAKTTRSPSPQNIFQNKNLCDLIEQKLFVKNKENLNNSNSNEVFRNSSPVNVSLFNGIILTVIKDGISIRNYKCENALPELNKQLKEDKIFFNGIPLQFNTENKIKKDIKCIKPNKNNYNIEHLQSFNIKSTSLKSNIHTNSIQRTISFDFESLKSFDKYSPLNEDTPVHCPMQNVVPVMTFNRQNCFNNSNIQEIPLLDSSFGVNRNEQVGKMTNNLNVVYSKPSVANNKFPNRKKSKSPIRNGSSITIRKPKIILFDSSECRISEIE